MNTTLNALIHRLFRSAVPLAAALLIPNGAGASPIPVGGSNPTIVGGENILWTTGIFATNTNPDAKAGTAWGVFDMTREFGGRDPAVRDARVQGVGLQLCNAPTCFYYPNSNDLSTTVGGTTLQGGKTVNSERPTQSTFDNKTQVGWFFDGSRPFARMLVDIGGLQIPPNSMKLVADLGLGGDNISLERSDSSDQIKWLITHNDGHIGPDGRVPSMYLLWVLGKTGAFFPFNSFIGSQGSLDVSYPRTTSDGSEPKLSVDFTDMIVGHDDTTSLLFYLGVFDDLNEARNAVGLFRVFSPSTQLPLLDLFNAGDPLAIGLPSRAINWGDLPTTQVPEPATIILLTVGLFSIVLTRRGKSDKNRSPIGGRAGIAPHKNLPLR